MAASQSPRKPAFASDRSVAFWLLLEMVPGYGASIDDGGKSITAFLDAWYESPSLDMAASVREWMALLPGFAESTLDGGKSITAFLDAWAISASRDLRAFAEEWKAPRAA